MLNLLLVGEDKSEGEIGDTPSGGAPTVSLPPRSVPLPDGVRYVMYLRELELEWRELCGEKAEA